MFLLEASGTELKMIDINKKLLELATEMIMKDLEVYYDVYLDVVEGEYFVCIPYYAHGRTEEHRILINEIVESVVTCIKICGD